MSSAAAADVDVDADADADAGAGMGGCTRLQQLSAKLVRQLARTHGEWEVGVLCV
jgi:hypothetical protein